MTPLPTLAPPAPPPEPLASSSLPIPQPKYLPLPPHESLEKYLKTAFLEGAPSHTAGLSFTLSNNCKQTLLRHKLKQVLRCSILCLVNRLRQIQKEEKTSTDALMVGSSGSRDLEAHVVFVVPGTKTPPVKDVTTQDDSL
ncbi:hypothetical protein E2C01_067854 [Portunus trituberculatus]|uniref:Uncharacterized protein n=1 Tax=Portunus trituberculatus TaxID=210409 RepID=A0A5B7HKX9_PORTR|nr:hypothetical protein [Portunus trituberculatus]